MNVSSLMTRSTTNSYALSMNRTSTGFGLTAVDLIRQQTQAVRTRQQTKSVQNTAANTRAADRTAAKKDDKKDNSKEANQKVAATQSSLANWAMKNADKTRAAQSATRTTDARQTAVENARAEAKKSSGTMKNVTSKMFSTQLNGYAATRNSESQPRSPNAAGTAADADAVKKAQEKAAQEKKAEAAEPKDRNTTQKAEKPDTYAIDADTPEKAKKAISEDGYWGAKQTSDRIVKYAKALTGGDSTKVDAMEKAFEEGYQEAAKAWGGEMPAVAQQTREAVLNQFQQMRQASAAAVQGLAATA